ncbi:MAG: hypothetical protein PHW00_05810 [Clostridia bacterium]|nr:hypothetical protein [Clostridia bacterium]
MESAVFQENKNIEHKKFDEMRFYMASFSINGVHYGAIVNVGKNKFNGKYHVYDINQFTDIKREGWDKIVRPKSGEQRVSQRSTISISQKTENAAPNGKKVKYSSTQVKSVTDNIDNRYGEDIRFSSTAKYSYETLTAKKDMTITVVDDSRAFTPSPETRKYIVEQGIQNAKAIGRENENGNAIVHVDDIKTDIIVGVNGLRHSIDRRINIVAPVTVKIGEILKNSIRINEQYPNKENIKHAYLLVGIAKNLDDIPYTVIFQINGYTKEVMTTDVLYSLNTKWNQPVSTTQVFLPR